MDVKPKGKRAILYHTPLVTGEISFDPKCALQQSSGPLWLCCLALGKTVIDAVKKGRRLNSKHTKQNCNIRIIANQK